MKNWKTIALMMLAAITAIAFCGGVIWWVEPREGEKVLDATACEIPENDTAYAQAVLQSDSLIRAQFLAAQSLQGPAVRGEAENLPDATYETRRAIESQQDRARRILEKRYCRTFYKYRTYSAGRWADYRTLDRHEAMDGAR